jgi:hypothetical protein
MSRSNPTLTNPARRQFQWSGSKGELTWYDKVTEQRQTVPLPFEFMVLDELAMITGYNAKDQNSFWSNEVRNISKDQLFVRTKRGPFEAGLYQTLTQTLKSGGKYTKSIYIAFNLDGKWDIGNIRVTGSALGEWIEFGKKYRVENGKVTMAKGDAKQTPMNLTYYPPAFTWDHSDQDDDQQALLLDKMLQVYLKQSLNVVRDEEGREAEYDGQAAPVQRGETAAAVPGDDVVIDDISDDPINLDDIPF